MVTGSEQGNKKVVNREASRDFLDSAEWDRNGEDLVASREFE
jgi:hypothetical protein